MIHNIQPTIFVRDVDYGIVKATPTQEEVKMGRRMAKTLETMAITWKEQKGRYPVTRETELLGALSYSQFMFHKRHYMRLRIVGGGFKHEEMRHWLTIAIQLLTLEYPMITFTYDGEVAEFSLVSNRTLADVVGLSNVS